MAPIVFVLRTDGRTDEDIRGALKRTTMWLLRFPKSTFQFASNHHATIKHVVLKVLEEDGLSEYLPALAGGGCVDLQSFHRLCDQRFF